MYKLILLFVFLSFSNLTVAQQKTDKLLWHFTIVDINTSNGIYNATVLINKRYYTTNKAGAISINKNSLSASDSILISCVGYKSELLSFPVYKEYPDTIKLATSVTSLSEVKISASKLDDVKAGNIRKRYNIHRVTDPNSAYVQFIPNEKKLNGTITSVEYTVNDTKHGIENPFRVRLYTKKENAVTLDRELTTDSIIVYNPEKMHKVTVDISKYNIQFPKDGILIVFETLSPSYYRQDSTLYSDYKTSRTPGIDMEQTKNNWQMDSDKHDRNTPYSMVGPKSDNWNLDDVYSQWYVYADGNNFAIGITVTPN